MHYLKGIITLTERRQNKKNPPKNTQIKQSQINIYIYYLPNDILFADKNDENQQSSQCIDNVRYNPTIQYKMSL